MIKAARVTVGTSATSLVATLSSNKSSGKGLLVRNVSGREIRTGGPDVTWADGMPLLDGETKSYDDLDYDVPYAIVDAGTAAVAVEQGGLS